MAEGYTRKNTFTLFGEYSNTSSHILMGASRQRVLADFGGAYARRLFQFKGQAFQYLVEVRPVTFESDPLQIVTETETVTTGPTAGTMTSFQLAEVGIGSCKTFTVSGTEPAFPPLFPGYNYTENANCGRQWTFAQAVSPVGLRYSMRTRRAVQPFVVSTAGYMYSNRPIPVADAGSFNFQFDIGAGVEVFRSKTRSVSVEARFHHFSNKNTANENPGVDNVNYKVSYSFGK
jgi:hypothetical protein